jgi:hypothetical protein
MRLCDAVEGYLQLGRAEKAFELLRVIKGELDKYEDFRAFRSGQVGGLREGLNRPGLWVPPK